MCLLTYYRFPMALALVNKLNHSMFVEIDQGLAHIKLGQVFGCYPLRYEQILHDNLLPLEKYLTF